LDRGFTT